MISNANHEFFDESLQMVKDELNRYLTISRDDLFTQCINERLKATLLEYGEHVENDSNFLMKQSEIRVFKAITRMQREEDKETIINDATANDDIDEIEPKYKDEELENIKEEDMEW